MAIELLKQEYQTYLGAMNTLGINPWTFENWLKWTHNSYYRSI